LRAKKIKIIGMDVDGVLTAGDILILESGEEIKLWNSKDRLAISLVRERDIPLQFAWITGRSSAAVTAAAKDLGVKHVVQGCKNKRNAMKDILDRCGFTFDQASYIGDDLIDLSVLSAVGLSACPSDAVPDVRKSVHYISTVAGGRGVVRDVLELVLRAQKTWDPLVASLQG
jgi:3-deoxy-D-manno-octulosonate 8-phosphate phosphatase (KDO 8-P phosphatase)